MLRGKPVGSPITWRRLRWFGAGDGPSVGDLVLSAAGYAGYLVEDVIDTGREGTSDQGPHRIFRVEATKLDPADIAEPDWIIRFD